MAMPRICTAAVLYAFAASYAFGSAAIPMVIHDQVGRITKYKFRFTAATEFVATKTIFAVISATSTVTAGCPQWHRRLLYRNHGRLLYRNHRRLFNHPQHPPPASVSIYSTKSIGDTLSITSNTKGGSQIRTPSVRTEIDNAQAGQ